MNSETTFDFLKKGFHVTLGATTAMVEAIQDPIKREETLAQIRLSPTELADRLAEKGAITEGEARRFVDGMMNQSGLGNVAAPRSNPTQSDSPRVDSSLQQGLQDLTADLADLRNQLVDPTQQLKP